MKRITFTLLVLILTGLLGLSSAFAQDIKVSGEVTDESGNPVAGVSVQLKGTQRGIITDRYGLYTVEVPGDGTLVYSSVGMFPIEMPISNRQQINVVMRSDIGQVDEVVVVAFGQATRSSFTGSAGVMTSDQLAKSQSSNVTRSLAGAMPGVQMTSSSGKPGSAGTISIRGIGSYSAKSQPLIVVDGVPFGGTLDRVVTTEDSHDALSMINPADIESVTVLKDAASNALYGARGANGVIMITTKKGSREEATVSFSARYGVNQKGISNYETIRDPGQYYEKYHESLVNYFSNALKREDPDDPTSPLIPAYPDPDTWVPNADAALGNHGGTMGLGYKIWDIPDGEKLIVNGKMNPNASLGYTGAEGFLVTPDDWRRGALQTGIRQEYNLSVSGGSDKMNAYFSFGYLNDEGIVSNTGFERTTARLNVDYQAKPWLKIGATTAYAHRNLDIINEDAGSVANIFDYVERMGPIYPLYHRDADGNIMPDEHSGLSKKYDYGDGANAGFTRTTVPKQNAIADNFLNANKTQGNSLNATVYTDINFVEWLKLTVRVGMDWDDSRQTTFTNPWYGQYATNQGTIYKYSRRDMGLNHQQLLNFNKRFGDHHVQAMVGHEYYDFTHNYLYGTKNTMYNPEIWEIAAAINNPNANSYKTEYLTEGYFGRVTYDYKNKYHGSFSYRRDASSRFHPDNRWGNFWSVGAAWLINHEDFMQDVEWVDMLKLKASFGQQGNDAIGLYRYTDLYSIAPAGGQVATPFLQKGNKDITWETNNNFNVGVEFGLFQNKLSGGIEYFSRKATDMLFYRPSNPTSGYTGYYDNIGSMVNRGVEIELQGVVMSRRNIHWTVYANATHFKNKITKLPPEQSEDGFESGSYKIQEGGSRWDWWMKDYAGVSDTGKSLWYANEDRTEVTDVFSQAKYFNHGTALPKVYGGFGTTVNFYGVDISLSFVYQIGGQGYDAGYSMLMAAPASGTRGQGMHKDWLGAWTKDAPTNIPRLSWGDVEANYMSSRFLTKNDYLSLHNITVGYTLPTEITSKIGIGHLRVYFTGDNLYLLSRRKGYDPRQNLSGDHRATRYSPIKTISGGIDIRF